MGMYALRRSVVERVSESTVGAFTVVKLIARILEAQGMPLVLLLTHE